MNIRQVHMTSLAAEKERRAACRKVLDSLPWEGRMVDAWDCRGDAGLQRARASFPMSTDEDQVFTGYAKWRGPLMPGEVGCAVSHLEVWREIAASPVGLHLVLEDDITVPKPSELAACLASVPQGFADGGPALLYLGYEGNEPALRPLGWSALGALGQCALALATLVKPSLRGDLRGAQLRLRYAHRPRRNATACTPIHAGLHHGTWSYIVNTAAAEALVALQDPVLYRSDEVLNLAYMAGLVDCFVLPSKWAWPRNDVASTIHVSRDFRSYTD